METSPTDQLIKINYCKPEPIDLIMLEKQYTEQNPPELSELNNPSEYYPFAIQDMQLYNPVYSKFFELNAKNFDRIALNHPYHMKDAEHIVDLSNKTVLEKPVFVKFSPLLDPFKFMIGKYDVNDARTRTMPTLTSTDDMVHPKILTPNNASYVDCFFSYLSSSLLHKHGFSHGVDFYGSFLGVQKKFRVCLTDDMDYLRGSDFFNENVGKLFTVEEPANMDNGENEMEQLGGSRRNKRRLQINDVNDPNNTHNLTAFSVTELDDQPELNNVNIKMNDVDIDLITPHEDTYQVKDETPEMVYAKLSRSTQSSSSKSSSNSEVNYSSEDEAGNIGDVEEIDEDDADEEDDAEDDDDENWETESDPTTESVEDEIYGYINNFPVQMICMEKCDGTFDQLFVKNEINEQNGASALFQVIMILLAYQKAFNFTHNDLHTNNIMYVHTDQEYLTYKYNKKIYKVPTYGKLFKIIDFGRSIYKFQERSFCSDSFAPGGDAATQYNFEPFMNQNKPRLEPNYAFDLCRLGSSIYDFLMDVDEDMKDIDELQKTIYRWCLDDNGKNVLYKKNGEERYPNFKLYKMIARTVHKHTPEAQLDYLYFSQFEVKTNNEGHIINMDIDTIPNYA